MAFQHIQVQVRFLQGKVLGIEVHVHVLQGQVQVQAHQDQFVSVQGCVLRMRFLRGRGSPSGFRTP